VESDFEIDEGDIRVRDQNNIYRLVRTPPGFGVIAFRNAVATAHTLWLMNGKIPTVGEMHQHWPKIPVKTFSELVLTEEFKTALAYRGIEWSATDGLSYEQNMALLKLSDPTDRRSTGMKLRELGIPYSRYQSWMRQPQFAAARRTMSENNLRDAVPVAINKLIENMESGDQRAIEKTLEISGRYNPAQQQLEDAKVVVQRLVESVVRNVKDPAVRRVILDDVEAEAIGYAISNRQALEK
jgi:hypothetical protein